MMQIAEHNNSMVFIYGEMEEEEDEETHLCNIGNQSASSYEVGEEYSSTMSGTNLNECTMIFNFPTEVSEFKIPDFGGIPKDRAGEFKLMTVAEWESIERKNMIINTQLPKEARKSLERQDLNMISFSPKQYIECYKHELLDLLRRFSETNRLDELFYAKMQKFPYMIETNSERNILRRGLLTLAYGKVQCNEFYTLLRCESVRSMWLEFHRLGLCITTTQDHKYDSQRRARYNNLVSALEEKKSMAVTLCKGMTCLNLSTMGYLAGDLKVLPKTFRFDEYCKLLEELKTFIYIHCYCYMHFGDLCKIFVNNFESVTELLKFIKTQFKMDIYGFYKQRFF